MTRKPRASQPMNYFTTEDDAKIIHSIDILGEPVKAVARAIGRSRSATFYRVQKLRADGRLRPAKTPVKTEQERAQKASDAFLDALKASETAPKTLPIPASRHPQRYSAPLSRSGEGSAAAMCLEN